MVPSRGGVVECLKGLVLAPRRHSEDVIGGGTKAQSPSMDEVKNANLDEKKSPVATYPPTPPLAASANAAAALLSIAALTDPALSGVPEVASESAITTSSSEKTILTETIDDDTMDGDWVVVNCCGKSTDSARSDIVGTIVAKIRSSGDVLDDSSVSTSPGSPRSSPLSSSRSLSNLSLSTSSLTEPAEKQRPPAPKFPVSDTAHVLNALDILAGIEVQAERLPEDGSRKRKSKEESPTVKRSKFGVLGQEFQELPVDFATQFLPAQALEVPTIGIYTKSQRAAKIRRYQEKKKNRKYNKKVLYHCRKAFADRRPRVGGRFVAANKKGVSKSAAPPVARTDEATSSLPSVQPVEQS